MARRADVAQVEVVNSFDEAISYYSEALSEPANPPWAGGKYTPVILGPTWRITDDGYWDLPEHTIGWYCLAWCWEHLKSPKGGPWVFTMEQARFILWWYAVNPDTMEFVYQDGVFQRLKGHGKDPLGCALALFEMLGPCLPDQLVDGWVTARPHPEPWVQTAAVSRKQTRNTMRLVPGMLPAATIRKYRLRVLRESVGQEGTSATFEAVTSSPSTLEGARATFVLMNETHHWQENNAGKDMAAVVKRNAAKSDGGAARSLRITNAFNPGDGSVAEDDRDAFEDVLAGRAVDVGVLYDSLEAPPEAPLSAEEAPFVVAAIRGDSVWLNVKRIVKEILDVRNPPSQSRRFWYNQIVAAEDAWCSPQAWDRLARPQLRVEPGAEVALFFDGSKSDDATALVGCDVASGHVFTLGVWFRPPGMDPKEPWRAPRVEVDRRVAEAFATWKVVVFWADPSDTKDDETQESYWGATVNEWHRRYGAKLHRRCWALGDHAVKWDMRSFAHQKTFTEAAMDFVADVQADDMVALTHDGAPSLSKHVKNVRRRPNKWGVGMGKAHRESSRKIDAAVCAVGARMARTAYLNAVATEKRRTGKVY